MRDAFLHCERLIREADKDRFLATLFAPADKRAWLHALYAFRVEIARIGEAVTAPMAGEIRLQWWRDVLSSAGGGEAAANPVAASLLQTIEHCDLPRDKLERIIEAHSFDLYEDPMPSWQVLEGYCERTAGAIFELAAQILAPDGAMKVHDLAREGGAAVGITAALARFARDAQRRRLYLPLEVLDAHEADVADIFAGRDTPQLRSVLAEARARARSYLAVAKVSALTLPEEAVPAFLPVVLARYRLARLELSPPFGATAYPQWRRQWLLWRAARKGLARSL
jgi:phytoene synthase